MSKLTQWDRDIQWLAHHVEGRRILAKIIMGTGCLQPPASTGNLYQLGRESVGHEFLTPLAFSQPGLLLGLLTEIQTASNDRARDRADDAGTDRSDD
jgi:hypothetical protein